MGVEENNFARGTMSSHIIHLAGPMIVAQLINVLYNVIDRIYIGRIPEVATLAMGGLGLCLPLISIIIAFANLFGMGGSPLCSIARGKGDIDEAEEIMGNSFTLLILFSILIMVIGFLFKEDLLWLFGASENTIGYANDYMSIYLFGTFFVLIGLGMNSFINSQGFAKIGMMTVMLGAVTNIILDPVFIFVFDMGVAGAAIATVIAQILSCLFALFFLFGKRPPVKISFGGYSAGIMLRIVAIGLSPFLILATDSVIMIVMNTVLQKTGGTSADMLIAAATIVQSYMMLITGPLGGISGGTQAIISFNYGAGKTDRVRAAEKKILLMCVVFTGVMFIASRFLAEAFAGIFITGAEEIALAGWGIRTFTLAIIPLAFQYALVDGLTAMGRTKTALFLSMFRKGSYALLIVIFAFVLGARNAFYAEPVVDLVGAIMSTTIFLLVFEKHMKNRMEAEII